MLVAAHSIAGGVLGAELNNPALAFLCGFALHFVLDAIPHFETIDMDPETEETIWTPRQIAFVLADAVIGLVLIFMLLMPPITLNSPFWWGAFGGVAPDILGKLPYFNTWFQKTAVGSRIEYFHKWVHGEYETPAWIGVLTQIAVIVVAVWWYLR